MTPLDALAVLGAGVAGGTINTVVGSGTLVSFPVLLALGYPPLVASMSACWCCSNPWRAGWWLLV